MYIYRFYLDSILIAGIQDEIILLMWRAWHRTSSVSSLLMMWGVSWLRGCSDIPKRLVTK